MLILNKQMYISQCYLSPCIFFRLNDLTHKNYRCLKKEGCQGKRHWVIKFMNCIFDISEFFYRQLTPTPTHY